jgi:hypothetical protein
MDMVSPEKRVVEVEKNITAKTQRSQREKLSKSVLLRSLYFAVNGES